MRGEDAAGIGTRGLRLRKDKVVKTLFFYPGKQFFVLSFGHFFLDCEIEDVGVVDLFHDLAAIQTEK